MAEYIERRRIGALEKVDDCTKFLPEKVIEQCIKLGMDCSNCWLQKVGYMFCTPRIIVQVV